MKRCLVYFFLFCVVPNCFLLGNPGVIDLKVNGVKNSLVQNPFSDLELISQLQSENKDFVLKNMKSYLQFIEEQSLRIEKKYSSLKASYLYLSQIQLFPASEKFNLMRDEVNFLKKDIEEFRVLNERLGSNANISQLSIIIKKQNELICRINILFDQMILTNFILNEPVLRSHVVAVSREQFDTLRYEQILRDTFFGGKLAFKLLFCSDEEYRLLSEEYLKKDNASYLKDINSLFCFLFYLSLSKANGVLAENNVFMLKHMYTFRIFDFLEEYCRRIAEVEHKKRGGIVKNGALNFSEKILFGPSDYRDVFSINLNGAPYLFTGKEKLLFFSNGSNEFYFRFENLKNKTKHSVDNPIILSDLELQEASYIWSVDRDRKFNIDLWHVLKFCLFNVRALVNACNFNDIEILQLTATRLRNIALDFGKNIIPYFQDGVLTKAIDSFKKFIVKQFIIVDLQIFRIDSLVLLSSFGPELAKLEFQAAINSGVASVNKDRLNKEFNLLVDSFRGISRIGSDLRPWCLFDDGMSVVQNIIGEVEKLKNRVESSPHDVLVAEFCEKLKQILFNYSEFLKNIARITIFAGGVSTLQGEGFTLYRKVRIQIERQFEEYKKKYMQDFIVKQKEKIIRAEEFLTIDKSVRKDILGLLMKNLKGSRFKDLEFFAFDRYKEILHLIEELKKLLKLDSEIEHETISKSSNPAIFSILDRLAALELDAIFYVSSEHFFSIENYPIAKCSIVNLEECLNKEKNGVLAPFNFEGFFLYSEEISDRLFV
ncbi:TPA: hypothetical protein DEO28_01035 [Candidatus Dependentiae bacterium]|nr:MAG: hypothetical protein UR14_C0003G0059 [candidate division TM6 bacterium GW2011_GWE2_31_21]KKP53777.1 MAG: hypothetical protein UR43_C0003G0098 [candidate division TM6 bacterium GW2011_GWF2_33_332]HBS48469.1 hypothetical protein [Candidatus Dependentiae bacterium]HBZ73084.1 hypothetical protein [Candidatus Dependentiae bacterium]